MGKVLGTAVGRGETSFPRLAPQRAEPTPRISLLPLSEFGYCQGWGWPSCSRSLCSLLLHQVLEEPPQEETAMHDQIQPVVVHPPDQKPPESPAETPEEEEEGEEEVSGPGDATLHSPRARGALANPPLRVLVEGRLEGFPFRRVGADIFYLSLFQELKELMVRQLLGGSHCFCVCTHPQLVQLSFGT